MNTRTDNRPRCVLADGSASGFLPLTTESVLALLYLGPSSWNLAPAPKKGPLFVRNKGSVHSTIHDDNWLLKAIHGDDYEWSLPNVKAQPLAEDDK